MGSAVAIRKFAVGQETQRSGDGAVVVVPCSRDSNRAHPQSYPREGESQYSGHMPAWRLGSDSEREPR